jgi:glycosyltransferase involved in cell wall biosynthesis
MVDAVDRIVVHSQFVKQAAQRDWGTSTAKFSVMPLVHLNFAYQRYRQIRQDEKRFFSYEDLVLLFGRLEEYKGIYEFIDAARFLDASDLQIKMVVAGSGGLSLELKACESLPNLEIRNWQIGDDETIELFGRAGLVVLPYTEGSQSALIPLAYLFKKPVLVTRVGALPEYVRDGVTGRVLDSNDPHLLSQAIHDMLGDKDVLIRMGRAGWEYLQELEEQFIDKLLACYTQTLEENQRA